MLLNWIETNGEGDWWKCAKFIDGRTGKQCRERWMNTLDPNVRIGRWSDEEEYQIFKKFSIYGSKWAKIAKEIPGRSENSIKNRFYSTLRQLASKDSRNIKKEAKSKSLSDLLVYFPEALESARQVIALKYDRSYLNYIDQKIDSESIEFLNRKLIREKISNNKNKLNQMSIDELQSEIEKKCPIKEPDSLKLDIYSENKKSNSISAINSNPEYDSLMAQASILEDLLNEANRNYINDQITAYDNKDRPYFDLNFNLNDDMNNLFSSENLDCFNYHCINDDTQINDNCFI